MKNKGVLKAGALAWFAAPLVLVLVFVVALVIAIGNPAAACMNGTAITSASDSQLGTAPASADLFAAIRANSKDNPRLALGLLMGSYFESDHDPSKRSADGAYGAWQIQDPGVTPGPNPKITVTQALNPSYSTNYMRPRYVEALRRVSSQLWESNPMMAGHDTAYKAERPAVTYLDGQGPSRVSAAYKKALSIMSSWGMSTDFKTPGSSSAPAGDPSTDPVTNADPAALAEMCNQYSDVSYAAQQAQTVIKAAQKYLGTPYVDGGGNASGPTASSAQLTLSKTPGFDDVGLTLYAYHQVGITLTRSVAAQYGKSLTPRPTLGQEAPADLVFFSDRSSGAVTRVGIVVDPTKRVMIIVYPGDKVRYADYGDSSSLVGFSRLLAASSGAVGRSLVGNDGFPGGQCVAYALWIVRRHVYGMQGKTVYGNGVDIAKNLGPYGFRVDHQPALHAVVSFPTSLADVNYGHVAIVSGINADGSLLVEEANWSNPLRYGTHTVPSSIVNKLTYAHVEVKWSDTVIK